MNILQNPIDVLKYDISQAKRQRDDLLIAKEADKKLMFETQKKDILLAQESKPISQNGIKAIAVALIFLVLVLAIR